MASSPLPEVDEDVGDATDLWESASLDYPGRNMDGTVRNSPTGWEFMNEDEMSFEEPHYYTWHLWFLGKLLVGIGKQASTRLHDCNFPLVLVL